MASGVLGGLRTGPLRVRIALGVLLFLGVGALLLAAGNLLVPFPQQIKSVEAFSGKDYAQVQLGAFERHPALIRSHVAMGAAFVLIAALQFWRSFRNRDLRRHRLLGYVGLALLVMLPVTGVASAIAYPFSGTAGVIPNLFWGAAIVTCVVCSWRAIRRRDVRNHEAWVTRGAAMTVGITLSRLYEPVFVQVFHMEAHLALAVVFWLGQGEGLIAAEVWLRRPGGPLARKPARRAAVA